MKASVIFYNSEENRSVFQLESGIRSWGILMLITAGRYTLAFPERGETFTVLPNTVSYIPPNTAFVRKIQEPIHFHQFHIECNGEDPVAERLLPGVLPIPKEQVSAVGRSLACAEKADGRLDLHQHILEHILVENYLFSSEAMGGRYSEDIARVVAYMQANLGASFRLSAAAKVAGLSPSGLIWKFRDQLKTTPRQYFIDLRIQQAKRLLLETDLSVTEIAEQCGYGDVYYFSNAFRKHTGVSPSAFRK